MAYTRRLAKAMRVAADRLEKADEGSGPDDYAWHDPCRCNCGFLAQVALDVNSTNLFDLLPYEKAAWADMAEQHCPATGLPMQHVFRILAKLGMKKTDFRKLERLADWGLCNRSGASFLNYNDKNNVAKYLRRWATEIEQSLKSSALRKSTNALLKSVRKQINQPLPELPTTKALKRSGTKIKRKAITKVTA